jgi:hypothetical protein
VSFKIGLKRIVNVFFWIWITICFFGFFVVLKISNESFLFITGIVLIFIILGIIVKSVLNYIVNGFFND